MRAESAWASEIRAGARVGSIGRARSAAHRAGGERGRQAGRQASKQAGRHEEKRERHVREAAWRVRGGALASKLRLTSESSFSSVNVCVASS